MKQSGVIFDYKHTTYRKGKLGTNGYKIKPRVGAMILGSILIFGAVVATVKVVEIGLEKGKVYASEQFRTTAYAPSKFNPSPTPTGTPTPTPAPTEHDLIVAEINKVFGSDAPKAFKLLSCENSTYNPDTVNTAGNHPTGSRDIGVFQVNEYWQQVQAKFLFNWKINVQIAKQLYDENDRSFKLWTCGRTLGI